MTAKIIDGKKIANKILEDVKKKVQGSKEKPGLAIVLVGKNPASEIYVELKEKRSKEIGFYVEKYNLDAMKIKPEQIGFKTNQRDFISRTEANKIKKIPATQFDITAEEIPEIRQAEFKKPKVEKFDNVTKLYSGLPLHELGKAGKAWTKYVGEPIWDKFITAEFYIG